jgi:hypothetical protein
MATRNSSKGGPLANLRGANKEAAGRYNSELQSRQNASRLLTPGEVSGDYDAGRLLSTTLGGEIRQLTHDDLRVFRQNVATLGKSFKGGVTAKTVVDMSLAVDRERANNEIRTAVPVQAMGGKIHFITNAGPNSKVSRHHIHVELMNFSAAVSSPGQPPDMVKLLTSGPLKFDCDCGRHTYWYRYIATVGRFNAGRDEPDFPKIRNPNLKGIACKHVLRVMQAITSPAIKQQIVKMIEQGRAMNHKPQVLTKAEAEKIAKLQREREGWKRSKIETTGEKRQRLAQARAVQAVIKRSNSALAGLDARKVANAKKQFENNARKLMVMGVLTQKQVNIMLGKL